MVVGNHLLVRTIVEQAGCAGLQGALHVAMVVAALCTLSRYVGRLALDEFGRWVRRFGDASEGVFAEFRESVHAHPKLTARGFESFIAFMYTLTRATRPVISRPRRQFEFREIEGAIAACGDRLPWGPLVEVAARRLDDLGPLAQRIIRGGAILTRPSETGDLTLKLLKNAPDARLALAMGMQQPALANRDAFPHLESLQVARDAQRMINLLYSKHNPAVHKGPLACNLGLRLLCGYPGPRHSGLDCDMMLATLEKWVQMSPGVWPPGKVSNKLLATTILNAWGNGYDDDFQLAAVLCGLIKNLGSALWSLAIRDSAKKTLATALLAAGIHCTPSRLNMESAPYAQAFFETVAGSIAASKKRAREARRAVRFG
tara:strand:- start:846 stop:1964 length:1119 start_codon:yes stop_codon:yes gene_type:complete